MTGTISTLSVASFEGGSKNYVMSFHIPALNDDSLMQNLMALVTLLDSLASHANKDVQQSVLAETNAQDVTEFRSMPWTVQSWRKKFRLRLRIAHLEEKEEVCAITPQLTTPEISTSRSLLPTGNFPFCAVRGVCQILRARGRGTAERAEFAQELRACRPQ
ncbi:hypothetical protein TRVL_09253 [Trypanosoma vivax]|nr:hypothetical protein TRVL_09253 [Trypanosoma vivax]